MARSKRQKTFGVGSINWSVFSKNNVTKGQDVELKYESIDEYFKSDSKLFQNSLKYCMYIYICIFVCVYLFFYQEKFHFALG